MSNTELAWAAGFFDGEGSVTLHHTKEGRDKEWVYVNLHVGQVDPRPLLRLQNALGLGKIYGPYRHGSNPNGKSRHDFFVRKFEEVQRAVRVLWPYLSDPKKEQINKVMQEFRTQRGLSP